MYFMTLFENVIFFKILPSHSPISNGESRSLNGRTGRYKKKNTCLLFRPRLQHIQSLSKLIKSECDTWVALLARGTSSRNQTVGSYLPPSVPLLVHIGNPVLVPGEATKKKKEINF